MKVIEWELIVPRRTLWLGVLLYVGSLLAGGLAYAIAWWAT